MDDNEPPSNSPPPQQSLPSNPLERVFAKLTIALSSMTSVTRELRLSTEQIIRNQLLSDKKIDLVVELLRGVRAGNRVTGEKIEQIIQSTRDGREDMREVRRMMAEQHGRIAEASLDIREARKDLDEVTGQHHNMRYTGAGSQELTNPPSGLHKGGFNLTWKRMGDYALKFIPWFIIGGGVGWLTRHFAGAPIIGH